MNRMRRGWLAASVLALLVGAGACGGSAQYVGAGSSPASDAKGAPADVTASSVEGDSAGSDVAQAEPGAAPAQPGFQQPSANTSPADSPSPAPPPVAARESSGSSGGGRAARPAPTSAPKAESAPRADAAKPRDKAPEATNRPGLGTQWGETRRSEITTVPFVRADLTSPFSIASLLYNDEQGAREMANASGFRRTSAGMFTIANGAIAVGLRDEQNNFLSGFMAGDRNYVVGEAGRRYSIVLRNRTPIRFECVISVDGLDVLDGRAASFTKRGYLLDPNGELEIEGFRQSMDAVAAFRFGSVRGSYANQKHGETRNVGVIGIALFHERGTNPFQLAPQEVDRRHDANPFPGQFATPPGHR
jgi:hypothetical protein